MPFEEGQNHQNFKDLTGEKIGNLTVLELTEKKQSPSGKRWYLYYLCLCSCGNKKEIKAELLHLAKNGKKNGTRSCGCLTPLIAQAHTISDANELDGRIFGRLKVLRRDFSYLGTKKKPLYSCICACGKIVCKRGNDLLKGRNNSCGCIKEEWRNEFIKRYCGKRPNKPLNMRNGVQLQSHIEDVDLGGL